MRIPGRRFGVAAAFIVIVVAIVVVALLVSRVRDTPTGEATASSTPSATPSPVFTSRDDAFAAAVEVYKKFEAASDAIGRDGGENPERIKPYVSEAGYEFELSQANEYKKEGSRGVGTTILNNAILQSYEERGGVVTVTMYVCEDISNVDRIDASGHSLVGDDRGDYIDYEVALQGSSRDRLVIHSNKFWTGGGICKF